MASVLKVDKLDPQSGTALEIGTSGDTITVPSGATLTVSGTMNASSITAGTMATARLGSGTASSTTVLYGDQTYKTEPAFSATSITGQTALEEQPATTDEIVLSDAGTLKKLDFTHVYSLPALYVWFNGSLSAVTATLTKFPLDTVILDTLGTYDNVTNYRWTPGIASWYWFSASAKLSSASTSSYSEFLCQIRKNGSSATGDILTVDTITQSYLTAKVSGMLFCNASDYVEVFVQQSDGVNRSFAVGPMESYLQAFRIIGLPTS